MADIKQYYYLKLYRTTCKITKHFSTSKIQQKKLRYIIFYQIEEKINDFFSIFKGGAIFLIVEQMEKIYFYKKDKNININNVKKIDLFDIVKYVKPNKKYINFKNRNSTYTYSRLTI